jgi:hypothetical protein
MAAGRYSFTLEQGATTNFRIEYKDSNNAPVDLSSYEARMQIRPTQASTTIICRLSSSIDADGTGLTLTPTVNGVIYPRTSGSIGIIISAASSSIFNFSEAYYDLEIYSGSGATQVVERIIEGKVKLSKEVTR